MINNTLRRNESKTGKGSLSQSTLLMEFGVCGVSSFSADGLFPSTSFPATKKKWFKTREILWKTMAHHGLEGLLLMAHKGSYHEQKQAHHDPQEGSCRIWNSLDPHAWVTRLLKSKVSKHYGKPEWWLQSPAFESWEKTRNKVAYASLISSLLCPHYDAVFNYITTVCSFLTYSMPRSVQIINAIQLISSYSILLGQYLATVHWCTW